MLFYWSVTYWQAGPLCRELFKAYIAEDCYYLDVFAKAFRIALGKSEGLPPDVSTLLIELHDGIAEELKLHKGYERETARSMDLDLEERQAKCQATKAYTDFLLHTAETEVATSPRDWAARSCTPDRGLLASMLRTNRQRLGLHGICCVTLPLPGEVLIDESWFLGLQQGPNVSDRGSWSALLMCMSVS